MALIQSQVVNTDLVDNQTIFPLELNTMPGWAGSSFYWMRYMDAQNEKEFASKEALAYWESVDFMTRWNDMQQDIYCTSVLE
jgi:leucyl-tRNA synthetase